MTSGFFITGTDTDVGKTWATVALMRYFKQQGKSVAGMKPVAAGCQWIDGQWKNSDALLIQQNASMYLDYAEINPYAFEQPVSPHLAAGNKTVELDVIVQTYSNLKDKAELVLVEGAGGWLVPINDNQDIADLAEALNIPVIVVVAIRLGCINHARLTLQAIQASGLECAGWLAMCLDPEMPFQRENIDKINQATTTPLLGVLPYSKDQDFELLSQNIRVMENN